MVYDYIIIGGGIVGVATARQILLERPGASLLVIEKESGLALHQTGRNSGVVHAGVYYAPGSLKARFCREGNADTKRFCLENNIPIQHCGKLIVATDDLEVERLKALTARSLNNGLEVVPLSKPELTRLEPHIRGLGALLVRSTSICNYGDLVRVMADQIASAGATFKLGERVVEIREGGTVTVVTDKAERRARKLIVCAGQQADRLARMCGVGDDFSIIPFRGEYFRLPAERNSLISHLVYPVPDPDLPFLGVHLTRMIDGTVVVGPNAVLSFRREGYDRFAFSLRDTAETLAFSGFWPMAAANISTGLHEMMNSLMRTRYLKECQKYCPELVVSDLIDHPAGIRAQAVLKDGTLVHDFMIRTTRHTLHVCNAPSPAATSAMPIARAITARVLMLEAG